MKTWVSKTCRVKKSWVVPSGVGGKLNHVWDASGHTMLTRKVVNMLGKMLESKNVLVAVSGGGTSGGGTGGGTGGTGGYWLK